MPRAKPREMPSCAYGTSCQRKGCVYKHPPKSKLKKPPEKSSKEICVRPTSVPPTRRAETAL
jgi:hypothetical protein